MGIHPHGWLGGTQAYRRIIIGDNVGKFKFPSYLRQKYWSAHSLGWVRDFAVLAAGFNLPPFCFSLPDRPIDHICYVVKYTIKIELLTQKNRLKMRFFEERWSECNYRIWKNPVISMVCRQSARGFYPKIKRDTTFDTTGYLILDHYSTKLMRLKCFLSVLVHVVKDAL